MNFNVITLGCKVNQYESAAMEKMLKENGFLPSENKEKADITVINTCTVTAVSDAKNRKLINRVRRNNPKGIIVLTGCMSQAFPKRTDLFKDCDIVLGNFARKDLIPAINDFILNKEPVILIRDNTEKSPRYENITADTFGEHTRAFVKIEDGCNRFCSYCIIPYARGRVRSKPLADLADEINRIADNGYKEVVLVGINLSAYGQDIGATLCDAVETVCKNEKILRVRLGSLEPEQMDEPVIARLSNQKKLCPQFHLSLQSGCDSTLRRMNRHYDTAEYERIVNSLKNAFENASVTTDIMVGFAGETDEEFQHSLEFVKKMGFAKAHVFPYSRRKGTAADKAPNQVDEKIKNSRSKQMIEVTNATRKEFFKTQLGRVEPVLFETMKDGDYCTGYTANYTPVRVYTGEDICSRILTVKITGVSDDYCIGELV